MYRTILKLIKKAHSAIIYERRVRILTAVLADAIEEKAKVLDVGCGQGTLGKDIMLLKPRVSVTGLEIKVRDNVLIPCFTFDGKSIPFRENAFDMCMFVDVLHHTDDAGALLKEATRVSRKYILIKDHCCENKIQYIILKIMDWVGNRPHDVNLTYNYLSKAQWLAHFKKCNLEVVLWKQDLQLYRPPVSWFCRPNLHVIVLLQKKYLR